MFCLRCGRSKSSKHITGITERIHNLIILTPLLIQIFGLHGLLFVAINEINHFDEFFVVYLHPPWWDC